MGGAEGFVKIVRSGRLQRWFSRLRFAEEIWCLRFSCRRPAAHPLTRVMICT